MITYFVAFLFALMVGAALTLVVRNRALVYGWVDQIKTSRKIHAKPIPRLGGVAIVLAFFAPLTALLVVDSSVGLIFRSNPNVVWGLFAGGAAIAVLGLYDDFRGAGALKKFTVQFAVAGFLYWLGFRVEQIHLPFFGASIALGYASLPFTLLWMVGVVNAMNLIDGLDGLAGGVAFFAIATNFLLAFVRGEVLMSLMMASLAGAVLGFLIFNFNPASIFMGDTGSMFLGFVLASVSIKTSQKAGAAVAMLVPVIALGLPIMDTLLAMVRRAALGRPMFSADKEHIHHRLMSRLVMSHRRAVLLLYGLCVLFALTALGMAFANSAQAAMLLCGISVVVVVLMRKLGYLNLHEAGQVGQVRRRNVQLRALVKDVSERVAQADGFEPIWLAVRPLAEALDASRLELKLNRQEDGVLFETKRPAAGSALPLEVRVDLKDRDLNYGMLVLEWRDGRGEVNRDEELALELLSDAVARAAASVLARAADPLRVVSLRK
ncbi:MAG TPA: MraY family glycosyltransferase [Myxococcaceae bacterium]|nr:MraY family glycosyltransferase [Myxococcaceae bacterium]